MLTNRGDFSSYAGRLWFGFQANTGQEFCSWTLKGSLTSLTSVEYSLRLEILSSLIKRKEELESQHHALQKLLTTNNPTSLN